MATEHRGTNLSTSAVLLINRRKSFKQITLGIAGLALCGTYSLPVSGEKTIMPEKDADNYVDVHVHVWTDDLQKYPLAAGFTRQDMAPRAFFPEEVRRHAEPCGVKRIVLVQMSYYGYDNSYMLDAIRQSPQVFRGIAVVDWKSGAADVEMRKLAKQGVRGFRIFPKLPEDVKPLEGESFYRMLRCGAEENLAMCLLINPDVLPVVDRICQKFPDSPVIIDHLARIGMDGVIREADVRALCALAKHPKTKVKVSAFYALGEKKPPHLDLAPFIRRVYDAFGRKRLMWGSDCPFQLMNETYADSFDLIRYRLDFLSSEDREWMLRRTAEEFFFLS
jgi:predicted TIM-barrel fold metal-dependent hydrolase